MIDSHCHLEQNDFEKDLDEIIEKCKESGILAIITSCTHPSDFERTMEIVNKYENYVFASVGIHPEYIKEINEEAKENFLKLIEENKEKVVSIGEIGLDYFWIKEERWRKKQRELFVEMLEFAKKLKKPVTVHLREAYEDGLKILEDSGIKRVHLHMFNNPKLVEKVVENEWYVSIGPIILRNKTNRKVAKKMPMNKLLLETDAPWNSPKRILEGIKDRNDPTSIKIVARKIAEVRKSNFDEIWKICAKNAIELFNLPISLP